MQLTPHRPSDLSETLSKAMRVVDGQTGIIKLLHEPPLAPDGPKIFGCGSLTSDFASIGIPSGNDISGSTSELRAQAIAGAVGEAVERYSAAYVPYERVRHSTPRSLGADHIDPERLTFYRDAQYGKLGFPFPRFSDRDAIGWVEGYALPGLRPVMVPAFAVFQPYVSQVGERNVTQQITTGLACGNTLEEAIVSGLCEVVERDAAMLAWLTRQSPPKLQLDTLPEGRARTILRRFGVLARHVTVLDVTSDVDIPAYVAVWDGPMLGERRAIFCSCAKPNADSAVAGALRELAQCMMWVESLLDGGAVPPDPDIEPIEEIQQHVLWPLRGDLRENFEFLLAAKASVPLRGGGIAVDATPLSAIEFCAGRLAACSLEAIAVDVTSPDIAEVGFRVARVIVPGAQPLYFGSGLERISARAAALRPDADFNLYPHPFP